MQNYKSIEFDVALVQPHQITIFEFIIIIIYYYFNF